MRKIFFLILLIIFISGCIKEETVFVTRVIDGDTIETSEGDIIRLLGINAPEKNEYYYEEATEYLKTLVENKYVRLEGDQTNKDWYGRELRYLYIGNRFVNVLMLENGYARIYLLKDKKYQNIFTYAEKKARDTQIGVWRYSS